MGGESFDTECDEPQKLTVREVLQIAEASSKALAFLHSECIVHRDVKPHNVFFERNEYNEIIAVKLADMGLGKKHNGSSTIRSAFAGTKAYAAPEAMQNRISQGSDVWSWACTIAHLATGVKPYEGEEDLSIPYGDELKDVELPSMCHKLLLQCFIPQVSKRPTAAEAMMCCQKCLARLPTPDDEDDITPPFFKGGDTQTPKPSLKNTSREIFWNFGPANYIDRAATLANLHENQLQRAAVAASVKRSRKAQVQQQHENRTCGRFAAGTGINAVASLRSLMTSLGVVDCEIDSIDSDGDGDFFPDYRCGGDVSESVETDSWESSVCSDFITLSSCSKQGKSPLMTSSSDGNSEMVLAFLSYGGDVNEISKRWGTPLMCACRNGHDTTAMLLLENGALIDNTDGEGRIALMIAGKRGDKTLTELLLLHSIALSTSSI